MNGGIRREVMKLSSNTMRSQVAEYRDRTAVMRTIALGDIFVERREAGRPGLPVMSVTMDRGLVERESLDRRVETALRPEQHQLAKQGDIVYNMMRMWQGVSGLARYNCILSPAYVVLRPLGGIDSAFASYLFKHPATITLFQRFSQGLTDDRLRLYFEQFRRIRLAIPASVPEQRRIAEILDTLDAAIRRTEQVIAKLRQMKQGLLHDLLTRGLDDNGELRDPDRHPEQFQDSPLGWLPNSWDIRPLSDLAEVASGITLGRKLSNGGTIEFPYLRVANVQDGYIDTTEIKTIRILPGELSRYALKKGDVLMTEGGDFDKLGRGAIWDGRITTCLHQNHIFRVRCISPVLNPRYLAYLSSSNHGKSYFLSSSKQTTNLASINSTQLKAFPVLLPPVHEQNAIEGAITTYDRMEEKEKQALKKLVQLKQGLMNDLLTGRVRVPVPEEATP